MAKKTTTSTVQKTEKELINERKKAAFEAFQGLNFDDLSPERRELCARELYESMTERPTPPTLDIPYDFWNEYDVDELKEIKRYVEHVDYTLAHLPKNPSRESWLDRERGIIPNMKREWKTKLDPFKNERELRKKTEHKVQKIYNLPENKGKSFEINLGDIMSKALANIEQTAYLPTRKKIEEIEEEVKKRIS